MHTGAMHDSSTTNAIPTAVRALAAIVCSGANMLRDGFAIAVAFTDGRRFVMTPGVGVRVGWDERADLRIITTNASLHDFLSGHVLPQTTFVWTGADDALARLKTLFTPARDLLGVRMAQARNAAGIGGSV